jgi:anti-sigma factor RsiW
MKCNEVHLAIGAEPQNVTPELEQHLRECASCATYRREMLELDAQIHRALKIELAALKADVPARPNVRLVTSTPAPSARPSWAATIGRQWALAASVLVAVAVAFVLWGALPQHSLAADIVAHVISEPLPASPVSKSVLDSVLHNANLRIDPVNTEVLFAQTCFFRGRLVPHFVVRSGDAAVTVLVLDNEPVSAAEHFDEGGYQGVLWPHGRGSIAVLSRTRIDPEKEAREILSALHSQPRA